MENSSKATVKLVGFWVSPYVHRVRWALKLKGTEYDYIEEDIFNRSPLLSELNPVYRKVPILVHDGMSLPESSVILEYIDQVWNHNPLLPEDPYQRAQTRFWAKFADEKVLVSTGLALCSEGEMHDRAVKTAIENLEKIEEKLNGNKFFGGDTIGYIDLMIGFISYALPVWEEVASMKILDPVKFPAIAAWTRNFLDHEAIKGEYLPSKDEMYTYYQWRRKELIPVFASQGQHLINMIM